VQLVQALGDRAGVCRSRCRIEGEAPQHELGEAIVDPRGSPRIVGGLVQPRQRERDRRVTVERQSPREQLEEHHAEGVDVAGGLDRIAADLLG
jgi:hypothetical protein